VTAPEQVASTAQEQAGAVAGTARDQAASVAQTATSAAGEVTGTAKEQADSVVGETVAQARDLTGQVRQQATQQVSAQTQKATGALRDLSRQLHEGDTSGMVGTVLTEVGQRVQTFADALEQKGPQGLLEDVRRYARRSPGSFVVGAALAGLVAGRLGKGLTASSSSSSRQALPAGSRTTGLSGAGTVSGQTYGSSDDVGTGAAHPTTPAYGSTTYGETTTYGGTPAHDVVDDELPDAAYASTTTEDPYRAGYGTTEAYGTRGAL
jgi:uncharacterized protein YjbJ (UPF0337 family)